MLIRIAWRNLWRNRRRSLIIQSSVVIGVVAIIFLDGLMNGMLYQMLFNQVSSTIAHIEIHKNGFNDNKSVQNFIPDNEIIEKTIQEEPGVKYYSRRVISFGLLSSASNSSGVYIYGVNPPEEINVSSISNSIIEGNYLSGSDREIVIGQGLADKLDVSLGDKVVAMTNRDDGKIGSDLFRVTGIYKSFSSEFDKSYIYIPIQNAQTMMNIGDNIYEFALILNDYKNAQAVTNDLRSRLSYDYEVLSYRDILPLLIIQLDLYKQSAFIITFIVSLALIFGIINTMIMAVFERINEFGVLMSIGMSSSKIFLMIVWEAFILGVVGTIAGFVIAMLLHLIVSNTGINLSMFAASLDSFGLGATIYPQLLIENIINTLVTIPFISVLGAIYPAYKAIKLEPVYALRYV